MPEINHDLLPLAEVERIVILRRLELMRGHRRKTAESLRISRRSLTMKLSSWNVPRHRKSE